MDKPGLPTVAASGQRPLCLSASAKGVFLLKLQVQPRASGNRIAGMHGEALKLRLTAPPVDGKANDAIVAFLADFFRLPKSAILVKSGHQSRCKTVQIRCNQEAYLIEKLQAALRETER